MTACPIPLRAISPALVLGASLLVVGGCAASTSPTSLGGPTPVLTVTHHVGGTHHRTLIHGGVWYQTFGVALLAIDPDNAALESTIELGRFGESAPATDLVVAGARLYVVLEDQGVVELDLTEPRKPSIVRTVSAAELGVAPRRLSVVGGELYVSGSGGVVRWSDRLPLLGDHGEVGRVAASGVGLVACSGRRTYLIDDGRYVGSASDLQPLPQEFGQPGLLVFERRNRGGTLVGLMTESLREVDARAATVAVPGTVHSVRPLGGRIWVVTDDEIIGYAVSGDRLTEPRRLKIAGARDVGGIDRNVLAVAGALGRAIVRLDEEGHTVLYLRREPAGLVRATGDGRSILAEGAGGVWLYEIGKAARSSRQQVDALAASPRDAATVWGRTRIGGDGRSVTVTTAVDDVVHREPGSPLIHCVVPVDGDVWIGHDHGITVLRLDPRYHVGGRLRLEGPVRYLVPLLDGGGAAFASESDGFGVVRPVPPS